MGYDLEDCLVLSVEDHCCEEYWVLGGFCGTLLIVQGSHVLILLFKLTTYNIDAYSHNLQLLPVK